MYLYAVYDKIQDLHVDFFISQNNKTAVRQKLPDIVKSSPLVDYELHKICDLKGMKFDSVVDWNEYHFPEDKAEALSPLQLSEKQKEMLRQKKIDDENYNNELEKLAK